MVTKILYFYVVCSITIFELFTQCQCSSSANILINEKITAHEQSRKLPDDVETYTTFTNLISEPNGLVNDDQIQNNDFQYYNEPIEITTPKYETIQTITYSNHQPIHQLDINHTFYPQLEQTAYVPSENYADVPPPLPPPSHHLLKVTREPFWAPDVIKLENQYLATFRSIKSSMMSFYYRMQNFVNYFMSFFSLGKCEAHIHR